MLKYTLTVLALAPAAAAAVEMPVVGAIRWDAYFSQASIPPTV